MSHWAGGPLCLAWLSKLSFRETRPHVKALPPSGIERTPDTRWREVTLDEKLNTPLESPKERRRDGKVARLGCSAAMQGQHLIWGHCEEAGPGDRVGPVHKEFCVSEKGHQSPGLL